MNSNEVKTMTDTQLIDEIKRNMEIQSRNHPDTTAATTARHANRLLFIEAQRRGLDSGLVS